MSDGSSDVCSSDLAHAVPDDLPIGRTMKAASTISVRDGHAIVKAGEFIEARFGAGTSPSLAARKTLALLIAKAAGEAWRPGSHVIRSEEHTSELQSLMRNSYAVFFLKKKKNYKIQKNNMT